MRTARRMMWVIVAMTVVCATACTAEDEASQDMLGTLSMDLTAVNDGTIYRMNPASFTVEGNGISLTLDGSAVPVLEQDLDVGEYSVTLSGWAMEADSGSGFEPIDAVLIGSETQEVSIENQSVSFVVYQFQVGDGLIQFGEGRLEISISIDFVCDGWAYDAGNGLGCWYTGELGETCNQVCADHGGFDAVASRHEGYNVGLHFWPGKDLGWVWETVECSSEDNWTNFAANGLEPDPEFSHSACHLNCACNE